MKRLAKKFTATVLALAFLTLVQPRAAEAQGLPTVDIIHNGRTMTIPLVALPGHLLHGDTLACVPPNCGDV